MMNLMSDGICVKCPYPHLYLECFHNEDLKLGDTYSYSVDCRHYSACMRAFEMGLSASKEGDYDENSSSGSDI